MWHNKPKNQMVASAPKAPAPLNATAQANKGDSGASLKFGSPTIRVGLNAAKAMPSTGSKKTPFMTNPVKGPKMPKNKKMIIGNKKQAKPITFV